MQTISHNGGVVPVSPSQPFPVVDTTNSTRQESYSQAVTFITGAAGFTGVVTLPAPILSLAGDKVGSHWRKNLVWDAKTVTVTETNGMASFVVNDGTYNLEHLFEGVGTGRFIARLTIDNGSEIWGYIGGVSASSNDYTFSVFAEAGLSTQNWNGTLPGSANNIRKLEIFSNQSSAVWTTGTILTEEVEWDFAVTEEANVKRLLATLTNGQYAIDYARGKVYYRKATTGTSDTLTYNTYGGSGGPTPDVNIAEVGGEAVGGHGTAVIDAGFGNILEAKTFDGSALPNFVVEGEGARQAGTLYGVSYAMLVNQDGSKQLGLSVGDAAGATNMGIAPLAIRDDELSTLSNPEGDYNNLRVDEYGALWVQKAGLDAGEYLSEGTNGVQATVDELLGSSTFTPDVYVSSALEDDALLTSNAANVFRASGYIDETAPTDIYWVFLLDSAAAPTNGAVTHIYAPIPVVHTQNTPSTWDFTQILGRNGLPAANGVAVALSTTPITLTLAGDYLRVGGLTKDA